MTVTREQIEKAEGDVKAADVKLTSINAEKVALDVQIAALDPDDPARAPLQARLAAIPAQISSAKNALVAAKTTLSALKTEYANQRTTSTPTSSTVPRAAPNAAPTGTIRGNTPTVAPTRAIAGSTQAPAPVPQGTVPPNSSSATTAAQPTQPSTSNASPQGEVEGKTGVSDDKTRYQLMQSWDEEAVINQLLAGDYFNQNLSNKYNNIAYHWRLFAMPDIEYLYDGDGQISTIQELFSRIDSYKQVTIAETGVTGFNIGDVTVESVYTQNAVVQQISMKVNEPNGVQFLDSLKAACSEAGVINYLDFFYYLELTFKGYTDEGEIELSPFSDLPNGGRWLWTVKIQDIDVSLGTGGGVYRLTMLNKDAGAMKSEYGVAIDTVQARGDTVGEFLNDLAKSLNKAWAQRLGRSNIILHKFQLHGIPPAQQKSDYITSTNGQPLTVEEARNNAALRALNGGIPHTAIAEMPLMPEKGDWNSIRNRGSDFAIVDPRNATNIQQPGSAPPASTKITGNIPRGTPIENIITQIFSSSETAQCMAKDSFGDLFSPDETKEFVNSKRFRECVTWKIIPEVRYIKKNNKPVYDYLSNRYARFVVWHVYPHIDQEPILSQTQISAAFDKVAGEKFQKGSVAALAVRGLLSKRYDYLFTGVNTEVLNIDLNFNMAWQVLLPRLTNYYSDQALTHASYNKDQASAQNGYDALSRYDVADTVFDQENEEFQRMRNEYNNMTPEQKAANAELLKEINQRAEQVNAAYRQKLEAQKALGEARKEREAYMRERFGDIQAPDQNYSREYVESVLKDMRDAGTSVSSSTDSLLVPFSFGAGDQSKQEVGFGSTGQYHPGRSLYGTILNQSTDPAVQKFTTINMTIRGDPYWLGEGSYEIAIAHAGDWRTPDLHDDRVGPNHVIMRFKYPTETDEGGNIVVRDNETVTGVYKITNIVNKFSNGQFTQELTGVRLALIDLYASLYGIPEGHEEKEQRDPVAEQRERIRSEETLKRITAEQASRNDDLRKQREAAEDVLNKLKK